MTELVKMKNDSRNWLVDVYRLLLIMWIALFHYTLTYNVTDPSVQIHYPIVFSRGCIGVSIFFFMSGYYMSVVLNKRIGGGRFFIDYCAKRYYRLWIPYVISCLIIYIIIGLFPFFKENVSFGVLLANLICFVHPKIEWVDGSHWFLCVLFVMQMIIGSSLLIKDFDSRRKTLLGLFTSYGVCLWSAFLLHMDIFNPWSSALLFMSIGIASSQVMVYKDRAFALPMIIGVLLVIAKYHWYYYVNIILFVIISSESVLKSIRITDSKFIRALGGISFCWYLVHSKIGCTIQYHLIPHDNPQLYWLLLPLVATLLIAIIVHVLSSKIFKMVKSKHGV